MPCSGHHLEQAHNHAFLLQSNAQAQALEQRQADLEAREESARQALKSLEDQQRRCGQGSWAGDSQSGRPFHCAAPCVACVGAHMALRLLRAFADADARKQELQLREDRILLKETELTSLEQSTRAGLKTAQKKVSCLHPQLRFQQSAASAASHKAELQSRADVDLSCKGCSLGLTLHAGPGGGRGALGGAGAPE